MDRQAALRVLIIANVREWRRVKVKSEKRREDGVIRILFREFTTPV
jgi:hypothetical protein